MIKILRSFRGKKGNVIFRDPSGKIVLPIKEVQEGKEYFLEYKEEKPKSIIALPISEVKGPTIIVRDDTSYWYDGEGIYEVPITLAASIYLSKKPRVLVKKSMKEEWKKVLNEIKSNTEEDKKEIPPKVKEEYEKAKKILENKPKPKIVETDKFEVISSIECRERKRGTVLEGRIEIIPKIPSNLKSFSDVSREIEKSFIKEFDLPFDWQNEDNPLIDELLAIKRARIYEQYVPVIVQFSEKGLKEAQEEAKRLRYEYRGEWIDVVVINDGISGFIKKEEV